MISSEGTYKRSPFEIIKRIRLLLDAKSMEWALDEMAAKLAKMHPSQNLIVIGMATRGIPLAEKLALIIRKSMDKIPLGSIDATFIEAITVNVFKIRK